MITSSLTRIARRSSRRVVFAILIGVLMPVIALCSATEVLGSTITSDSISDAHGQLDSGGVIRWWNYWKHPGDKLSVQIDFLNPYGETTANASGTTYSIPQLGFNVTDPAQIYARQIWGTYPLYLVGQPMNFDVTVTNTAARGNKPFNIRVEALSNVLNMNGSAGVPIGDQEYVVENLRPGESRTLTYSVGLDSPDLFKGLNVTNVEIFHVNKGNTDAALISRQKAYWCPPSQADLLAAGVGSTVPEPSGMVLLAIGAASLFAYDWRRRRKA